MKEAIQEIITQAEYWETEAVATRATGDHIKATRQEKLARNLHKIAKLARAIFLP